MPPLYPSDIGDSVIARKCERVLELREFNREPFMERLRIKHIMDGGVEAVVALLGDRVTDPDLRLPVANLMLSAVTRLAQKLGRPPDVKVDPPVDTDSEAALKAADKRARIVSGYDEVANLPMLLPQIGRWLPGYGYTVVGLKQVRSPDGQPFPGLEVKDPFETLIGEWGPEQQPPDYAVVRTATIDSLLRMPGLDPSAKARIERRRTQGGSFYGGAVLLDDKRGWSNQGGAGLEVYEYTDDEGCWWVLPEEKVLLSYIPNMLSRPPFWVFKRFSFARLTGQYDHVVGLMAAMARLNLLAIIGIEDSVLGETNVIGDTEATVYKKGRDAVNYFSPGTSVQKMHDLVPFEAFTQLDRLERQLRIVAGYPVTDDAQHPGGGWATGRGLQELTSAVGEEVREYHTVLSTGLSRLDALRLEADEAWYPDTEKTTEGAHRGTTFVETYTPSKHIKGHRRTRRVYGAMAGWDDSQKIVGGLQLLQGGIIDDDTFRENLDGLENTQRIKERILAMNAERVLFESLAGLAQQGDPTALDAAVKLLPPGSLRSTMEEVLLARTEQATAEAEAQQMQALPGEPPPDVATVLSRLSAGGQTASGSQVVGRLAS